MAEPNIAIVGITGAVGQEMINCLEERNFPVKELRPLASARSAGKKINFRGHEISIQELTEKSFEGIDIALFSAGGGISKTYAPKSCFEMGHGPPTRPLRNGVRPRAALGLA